MDLQQAPGSTPGPAAAPGPLPDLPGSPAGFRQAESRSRAHKREVPQACRLPSFLCRLVSLQDAWRPLCALLPDYCPCPICYPDWSLWYSPIIALIPLQAFPIGAACRISIADSRFPMDPRPGSFRRAVSLHPLIIPNSKKPAAVTWLPVYCNRTAILLQFVLHLLHF